MRQRWPTSRPDDRLTALESGQAVEVSPVELLKVGGGAGVRVRDVSFGAQLFDAMLS